MARSGRTVGRPARTVGAGRLHFWADHPGAVVEASRGVVPPTLVRLADTLGAALVDRGFTARDAVLTVDLVFDLVTDNRRGIEAYDTSTEGRPAVRGEVAEFWATSTATSTEGQEPDGQVREVRAEMVRAIETDPQDWFTGKLRVVLAGVEARLAPRQESP